MRKLIRNLGYVDWLVELTTGKDSNLNDSVGGSLEHILSGILGASKVNYHDVPFAFTEEFVAIYRMHTLLCDELTIKDLETTETWETVALADGRNEDSVTIMRNVVFLCDTGTWCSYAK